MSVNSSGSGQQLYMKDDNINNNSFIFPSVPQKYEESEEVEQQISEITTYIDNYIDLPYKKEFLSSLGEEQPYQRNCFFFNDNKKYRQIHQLVRVFKSLANNYQRRKYHFNNKNEKQWFQTTRDLERFFTKQTQNRMPGAIVFYNRQIVGPFLNNLADKTKEIIQNIASPQYCLGCCGKNSVKVKE